MKHRLSNYLWAMTDAEWDATLAYWPRENLQKFLYDMTPNAGVFQGLEIVPNAPVGLSVVITRGRGVIRDNTNRQCVVIEALQDTVLDLSSHVPASGAQTYTIWAERFEDLNLEPQVTPTNPAPTHPDYDAAYVPVSGPTGTVDSTRIRSDLTLTVGVNDRIALGQVTLTAGQTQITAGSITTIGRVSAGLVNRLAIAEQNLDGLERRARFKTATFVPANGTSVTPGFDADIAVAGARVGDFVLVNYNKDIPSGSGPGSLKNRVYFRGFVISPDLVRLEISAPFDAITVQFDDTDAFGILVIGLNW
jgi:hypothetical protein